MKNTIIGIDLGTTNSVVSVYENGEAKIIPNNEGKNTTPSIVAFTDKGDILIGESAKRQAITNPEKTIYSIKRIMGMNFDDTKIKEADDKTQYNIVNKNGKAVVQIGDKTYTPEEISAKILAKLKTDAEKYLGYEVNDAIISVPAYFGDSARKSTKDAGTIAGLNVKRIINEPTAASLAYGLDEKNEEKVVIFDCGGGTHDVSLLEISDGTFEVLATDGNAFLGGQDFSDTLTDFVLEEANKDLGIDLSNDKMAMQRIVEACEISKIELSSTNETKINLPFITADASGPKHLEISITKSKFESLIEDLANETITHIETCLKEANIAKNEINEIVMVGGSTRIPLIQEKVKKFFNGKQLNNSVNPDEIVSLGCAVQGGVLSGDVKDVLLLDVTPLSLGIEVMGGVIQNLIEKGTTIPISKSEIFSNAEDNQPQATIHVLQGENKMASGNKSLGQFNVDLTPAPRGQAQVEVKFDIDANGVLTVSAKDKTTGKENNITISGSSGLSEDEINKMVQEAEKENSKNKEKVEAIQKRNELDSLSYSIEKSVTEQGQNIDTIPGLKEIIEKAKDLVKNQSEDKAEIEDTINKLNQIVSQMQQQTSNCNSGSCNTKKEKQEDIIDAEID